MNRSRKLDHGGTLSALRRVRTLPFLMLMLFGIVTGDLAQSGAKKPKAPPIAMPADRAVDSYKIYSLLMPVGELASPSWPHDFYLLADTITVNPTIDPREAFQVPPNRAQDFEELLQDYDRHSLERVKLSADGMKLKAPLRMLNEKEQEEFENAMEPNAPAELKVKYKGAAGFSSFSQVYFNQRHTVAMVFAGGWCGNVCGEWYWAIFELDSAGNWKALPWSTAMAIS